MRSRGRLTAGAVAGRFLSAALLVLAALGAAGCGTSVNQHDMRYSAQLQAVGEQFQTTVSSVLHTVGPATPRAQAAVAVGSFETRLAAVDVRLTAMRAPAIVSRLHRSLVKAINRYAVVVRRELVALRSGDAAQLATSAARFERATRALQATVSGTVGAIEFQLPGHSHAGGG